MKGTKNTKICITITAIIAILAIIATIILTNFTKNKTQSETVQPITDPEILRSLTYEQITPEEEQGQNEYVKFLAFFTRDLDNDGYAEKLKGTCREISDTDELYIELNVLTDGYLKDGVITLNAGNFTWKTAIVSDNIVKGNYIGNTTSIKLQDKVTAGSQKMLWGTINANIGNNINNYSKEATVTLTGTHVSDDGKTETPISKTVKVMVDWHGSVGAEIIEKSINRNIEDFKPEGDIVNFQVDLQTQEPNKQLLLKENVITAEIPLFNGFEPTKVTTTGEYVYDEQTRTLTVKRTATVEESGKISKTVGRQNIYRVNIEYPKEAYVAEANSITLEIPVTTYYVAYNNNNEQFKNPITSNVVRDIVALSYRKPLGYVSEFNVTVGDLSRYGYAISKEKPLQIYNGTTEETTEDYYKVQWELSRGNLGEVTSVVMKENPEKYTDEFLNTTNQFSSMEQYSQNIGIYFLAADFILGDNGYINVYNDETNELIHTFTKEEWNKYSENNIYKYEKPIKHVRIETSTAAKNSYLKVTHVKEINDELLVKNITKADFDKLKYVYSYLQGSVQITGQSEMSTVNDTGIAQYLEEVSCNAISVSYRQIETQKTINNFNIKIQAVKSMYNDSKWKNGQFIVKLPSEIIATEINEITTNNSNVKIIGYDLYENEGSYFIKILTEHDEEGTYDITINCNITPDPATKTSTRQFELYAYNEIGEKYVTPVEDKYDVNANNNVQENVNYCKTDMGFISPSSIITSQYISNYNAQGTIKIAPNIADIEKGQKTANINLMVLNNYTQNIDEVKIQGVIPSEGNSYIVNGNKLGSQFTTTMGNKGIQVPEELKNVVTVYYSEKSNPTKDITDSNNGWKKTPDDWSKIKSYLIDFGDFIIPASKSYTFSYEIQVPEKVEYNKVSYSQHAVYFALDTEGGKLLTQTEPNKLGIRAARYFGVNLTKYKLYTDKTVGGATYQLIEKDKNGNELNSRLLTTKENGQGIINNLYVGSNYTLKELISPNNYELNDDEIDFYITEQSNGELKVTITSEDNFSTNPIINNQEDVLYATVENMPRYNLVINKVSLTGEKIENVRFDIKEKMGFYRTDENGQILVTNLVPNQTYTLVEKKADGYYVDSTQKTFKLIYEKDSIRIETNDEELKNAIITNDNNLPCINMEITISNEKIPTYNLQILKVAENDENNTGLSGATIELYSDDKNETYTLTTDSTGTVNFNDLYAYVEGKYITGKYTLKELVGPNGYATNPENINFVVESQNGNLVVNIENEENLTSYKSSIVEGNTVKIIIQDKPLFKVTKIDSETGEPLANVKFAIYKLDENGNEVDYAKGVDGNYVGEQNENGEYLVSTDENGVITLPLSDGIYKIVEVEYPEGYEETINEEIFKISGNNVVDIEDVEGAIKIEYIEDLVTLSNEVNAGDTKANQTIQLMRTLDFEDVNSYRNAADTSFGDLNGDGSTEGIKAELTDKVDGVGFTPIGNKENVFSGTFDGQGFEIRNLYVNINYGSYSCAGLFGYISEGKISRLGVTGENTGRSNYCGGIVGFLDNASIEDCHSNVNITWGSKIGGIAGEVSNGSIYDSYNYGNLSGYNIIGGIVGEFNKGYIEGCNNIGKIVCNVSNGYNSNSLGDIGGIIGIGKIDINNCYNSANITVTKNNPGYSTSIYIGGIIGSQLGTTINSYNIGDINNNVISDNGSGYGCTIYIGGIAGSSGMISNCYNIGNISSNSIAKLNISENYIGGIVGEGNVINNCYNEGYIYGNNNRKYDENPYIRECYVGGIVAWSDALSINNVYNTGNISSYCCNADSSKIAQAGAILGHADTIEEIKNAYYLENIEINGENISDYSIPKTKSQMTSQEFYNTLNTDNVWLYRNNKFPVLLKTMLINLKPITDIVMENTFKRFAITTEVGLNSEGKRIGGTVSGIYNENYLVSKYIQYVETLDYKNNSTQAIEIRPDNDYQISEIIINGENLDFIVDENRNVLLSIGYFKEVTENKHIVVKFEPLDNLIIHKLDENDNSMSLSGAKFKIEANINPNDLIGNIQNPSTASYHFKKVGTSYESTNDGVSNSVSNSYFPIDLKEHAGKVFTLSVNASISSESVNYDVGYATVTTSETVPTYSQTQGRFIYIGGTNVATQTYTTTLQGGQIYYLHLGYKKDSSVNGGNDKFTINSINLTCSQDVRTTIDEITTNSQGIASIRLQNDIELAITEIQAPEGYQLNTTTQEITIPTGEIKELTITNKEIESNFKLNKIDEETKQPLPGAEFEIYKNQEQIINRDEIIYKNEEELYYIEAEDSNIVSGNKNWANSEYSGGYGVDYAKDISFTFNVEEKQEYVFKVAGKFFNSRNFNVYVNDELYKECNAITTVYSYTTCDIPLGNLEAGTYTIRLTTSETFAPIYDYFEIYSNVLDYKYSMQLNLISNVQTHKLKINAGISGTEEDYGYVEIEKTSDGSIERIIDLNGNVSCKDYSFELNGSYNVNFITNSTSAFIVNSIEAYSIGDLVTTITTDEDGKAKVDLQLGSYLLTETNAPEGYILNEQPQQVEIGDEGTEITVTNKTSAKHQITTRVEKPIIQLVDGGTISGQNETPYEEVNRYETSTKDILVDPSDGYKIKSIKINGTEISFTPDADGNVLLDKFEKMIEDKEVVVMFTPIYEQNFTLIKTDEYTNEPLQGIQFAIYYLSTGNDFAKDLNGKYIGEQDENGMYLVTTDANGEIKLSLPTGSYKAVEIKGADGYVLAEKEEDRTTYFKVMPEADVEISCIEDLIDFANNVTNGNTYEGKTVALTTNLDFKDANSYRNANDTTTYADYNQDGTPQSIMEELTNTASSGFKPVGLNLEHTFKGVFEGNEFEIKNLYINSNYGALFTSVENGEIRNLKLTNVNSTNSSCGSSLARNIKNTKVINCSVDGIVRGRTSNNSTVPTGGIIYDATNSEIMYCHNKAEVDGVCVGGVVAYSNNSLVENCSNTGKVTSTGPAGGLVYNLNGGTIKNSYNTGNVNCTGPAGGLTNYINNSIIQSSYNTGDVVGSGTSGGIACTISNSTIENFYNTGKITDPNSPAGGMAYSISGSTLKNCYNMADVYGGYSAGGMASFISDSNLENCYNTNSISSKTSSCGGIAATISNCTLKQCGNKGAVSSETNLAGGIAAEITNSTLEKCFNENTVHSDSAPVGGIAYDVKNSTFTECYNKGDVSSNLSNSSGAGISGFATNLIDSKLTKCYNAGNVTSLCNAGGISNSIANTDLENCYNTGNITATSCAGGISNNITNSTIEKCANMGIVKTTVPAGGIAFSITNTTMVKCYNTADVYGPSCAGGIVYNSTDSLIQDCYNTGNVYSNVPAGGIAYGISGTIMNNCYNTGKVTGNYCVAGVVEYVSSNSVINNCYNAGEIAQTSNSTEKPFGGVVYSINSSTLTNTYYLNTTAATGIYNQADVSGVTDSMAKTAMQSRIFKNLLNNNKDKIETTIPLSNWVYQNNNYPTLDFEVDMSAIEIELPEMPNIPTDNTNNNTSSDTTTQQPIITPNYEEVKSELNITNSKSAKITVHHYLEGTGPEYETEPTILSPDEIIMGKENYDYATSPKLDIEGYNLIKDVNGEYIIPKNASGKYTEDEQHIYYYYNVKPLELVVHHYLDGTEDKLVEDELYYYNENDHYKTTPSEELLEAYEVASVVGDEEKDITQNEVVTYYYKHKQVKITTRVEIPVAEAENGRTEKGGEILGEGQEPYETVNYGENSTKEIIATPHDGYKLGSITVNGKVVPFTIKEGKISIEKFENMKEDKEVVVTFVPTTGKVITHHYLVGTCEKLHEDIISIDRLGAVVKTEPVNIDGYKLVDSAGNKDENGNVVIVKEVAEGVEEIIYYYQNCYIITTDVIEHDEKNKDGTVKKNVKGGDITNEDVVIHEQVVRNENSKDIIEMKPHADYEIVEVRINGKVVGFEEAGSQGGNETVGGEQGGSQAGSGTEGGNQGESQPGNGTESKPEAEIDGVIISSKLYLDNQGNLRIPTGFFQEVQQNIHVEVKYRRKSKVIVKYLEKDTETELSNSTEIIGHEGKEFKTTNKIIPGYTLVKVPVSEGSTELTNKITDENNQPTKPNGTMFSDDITIIYWYEKVDANVVERHIETNAKGEEIELETILHKDSTAANVETKRKVFEKYGSIDAPEETKEEIKNNYPNVTLVGKDENKVTVEIDSANVKEVWYYYVKQYDITTEVKKHKETVNGIEKEVEGGTISKEYKKDENEKEVEVTYEVVNSRADSAKEIKMVPDSGYRIKSVTINDEEIFIDNMVAKDGSLTLPVAYFKDVQKDYHVVVEFKPIPAKVVVKYIDEFTKESIIPDKVIEGFVNNEYNEPRVEIDSYIAVEPEPENSQGKMTEEGITIVYYYGKQFRITTDVIEHLEDKEKGIVDVIVDKVQDALGGAESTEGTTGKENESTNSNGANSSQNGNSTNTGNGTSEGGSITVIPEGKVLVKGGSIQGEDEESYETVSRGKDNTKQILIKPDSGYRIKSVKLKDGEDEYVLSVPELLTKENTIILPVAYFKNMQSDKHITVEFEPIPVKVVVNYLDIETKDSEKPEKVSKQEVGEGFVNYDYKTYEKQIPYYEIVKEELPANAVGKLTEKDTIVNYWYRKLLFNMKLTKEFSSIQVNGVEMLKEDKKFAKVDVTNTEVANTNILVKYIIRVTNTEEVEGVAKVVESIPVGFKFVATENAEVTRVDANANQQVNAITQWKEVDGKLELTTRTLKPGETAEYEITLEWDKSLNCMGTLTNTALISQTENIPQYQETTQEDNKDSCTLILAVRTREDRDVKTIISMSCFILAGICTVVYVGTEVWARKKENE